MTANEKINVSINYGCPSVDGNRRTGGSAGT
jgi:hypothetical protein